MKLETLTPLSIHSNRAMMGAGTTVGYIAGNTVLGSLAAVHRLSYPSKKDEFEQLFLRGHLHYPNLYPASNGIDTWQDIHHPVYPLPKTAQSCKLYSGFRYPEIEGNNSHGVRDTLINWALFKVSAQTDERICGFEPLHAFLKDKKCRICKEPMQPFSGYYRRDDRSKAIAVANGQGKQLQTRVGINREADTEQESISYSQQVFDEGVRFWGAIKIFDDRIVNAFKNFVSDVGTTGLVRIGTGRTRGMGKVSIEVIESSEGVQERHADFTARLQSFNTQLLENVAQWKLKDFQRNYFFAITLHSPLLLNDEFLRYRGVIDAGVLKELLAIPLEGLEQVYHHASIKRIMGWQELWGTPRMNEYAIDTGSVFLFRCVVPPAQSVIDALFRLEEQGIGERRAEGFGRICISDPFHKEVEPN
jgi:CRISPR-associated protein Csx10